MRSNYIYPDKKELEQIFAGKDAYHKEMAMLPIEEKIKILVKLQEIAINARPDDPSGKLRMVWKI